MALPRLAGGSAVTSYPPSLTVPLVTVSWPATMRKVEVFPHPEGPSRQQ